MNIQDEIKKNNKKLKHLLALKHQQSVQLHENKYVIFSREQGFDTSKYNDMGKRVGLYTTKTYTYYYLNPKLIPNNEKGSMDDGLINDNHVLFTKEQAEKFVKNFPSPELVKHNIIPFSVAFKKDKVYD